MDSDTLLDDFVLVSASASDDLALDDFVMVPTVTEKEQRKTVGLADVNVSALPLPPVARVADPGCARTYASRGACFAEAHSGLAESYVDAYGVDALLGTVQAHIAASHGWLSRNEVGQASADVVSGIVGGLALVLDETTIDEARRSLSVYRSSFDMTADGPTKMQHVDCDGLEKALEKGLAGSAQLSGRRLRDARYVGMVEQHHQRFTELERRHLNTLTFDLDAARLLERLATESNPDHPQHASGFWAAERDRHRRTFRHSVTLIRELESHAEARYLKFGKDIPAPLQTVLGACAQEIFCGISLLGRYAQSVELCRKHGPDGDMRVSHAPRNYAEQIEALKTAQACVEHHRVGLKNAHDSRVLACLGELSGKAAYGLALVGNDQIFRDNTPGTLGHLRLRRDGDEAERTVDLLRFGSPTMQGSRLFGALPQLTPEFRRLVRTMPAGRCLLVLSHQKTWSSCPTLSAVDWDAIVDSAKNANHSALLLPSWTHEDYAARMSAQDFEIQFEAERSDVIVRDLPHIVDADGLPQAHGVCLPSDGDWARQTGIWSDDARREHGLQLPTAAEYSLEIVHNILGSHGGYVLGPKTRARLVEALRQAESDAAQTADPRPSSLTDTERLRRFLRDVVVDNMASIGVPFKGGLDAQARATINRSVNQALGTALMWWLDAAMLTEPCKEMVDRGQLEMAERLRQASLQTPELAGRLKAEVLFEGVALGSAIDTHGRPVNGNAAHYLAYLRQLEVWNPAGFSLYERGFGVAQIKTAWVTTR